MHDEYKRNTDLKQHQLLLTMIITGFFILYFFNVCHCQRLDGTMEPSCISTYQELKALLRSNNTSNVKNMLDVFYPPNKSPSHVVFVRYCVRNNATMLDAKITNGLAERCNETFIEFQFQWITNTIPLLIDSDVFMANTFNFAYLVQKNLTLLIDLPFCEDTEGLVMLETLTVWLKSYAQSDEDLIKSYCIMLSDDDGNSDEGYLGLFDINGTQITFIESRLLASGKKFVIGLWLGVTSITFALILHIGRVSAKTANALNKVLWELTAIVDKIIGLPQKLVGFMQKGLIEEEKNTATDATDDEVISNLKSGFDVKELQYHVQQRKLNVEEGIETAKTSVECETLPAEEVGVILCANETTEVVVIENTETDVPLPNEHITFRSINTPVYKNTVEESANETSAKLQHAFNHFAKSIQKMAMVSTVLVLGFLFYDIYIYMTKARKLSYDWLILFPIPFWSIVVTIINLFMFVLTEIVLYCKQNKEHRYPKRTILFKVVSDFFITMSATTVPMFAFFHLFWLILALSAFSIRLLSSATFYLPLVIFGLWLLSVTTGIFKQWKDKLFTSRQNQKKSKTVAHFIGVFFYPLIPLFFLPFWVLLLATLHLFSDFLLEVVNLEEQNLLIVIATIAVITLTTRKISKHCQPQIEDD